MMNQRPTPPTPSIAPPAFQPPAGFAPQLQSQPPVQAQRNFWAFINGATTLVTEAQARTLAPDIMLMDEAQSLPWTAAGQVLANAQPQVQQPAFQQPQQPAFQQPQQPAFQQPQVQQPAFQQPQQAATQPGWAATAAPAGLFNGVSNASVTRRGNNMNPGDYIARFIAAEYKEGQKGSYVISEVEIVATSFVQGDPIKGNCNPIGQRVSVFVKRNQSFDGNIKEIMLALSPHNSDGTIRDESSAIPPGETAALLQQPCPFAGQYVYMEARDVDTKGAHGQPPGKFTRISWWHCPKDAAGNPDTATMAAKYR